MGCNYFNIYYLLHFAFFSLAVSSDNSQNEYEEIIESPKTRNIFEKLTDTAKELLIEVAKDGSGNIMRLNLMDGLHVQTNNLEFGAQHENAREIAKIEEAVELLENFGLITDLGYKREVFRITAEGYRVADELSN